jgi:non-specific serine/threonine protein kinase
MSEMVELSVEVPAAFAWLLREHRLAAGLTQEALAERAGVGFRTIQDLEGGAHHPRRGTLAKLVCALGLVGARRDRFEAAAHPMPRSWGSTQPFRLMGRPDRSTEPNPISHHNLPIQMTSFVGRGREVAALTVLLRETRLLTLTGTGGCGKTRLALRVVEGLVDDFPDGAWLVELAPIGDPAFIPHSIAAALGVREEPPIPIHRTILDYLRTRRLLLIVDNCEHVIVASAHLIETILRTCPRVTILATSREALNLAGEVAWRVPSLTLPSENGSPVDQELPDKTQMSEAVQMFVDRAKATDARFKVTPANAPTIAQICRRLDGIPLALELAAARLKVLSVEQVAARLDDRFRLLTGGSRTALPRQQTLRATLDWSYALLSESERQILRQLAVFAGGWTLDAAETVCRGSVGNRVSGGEEGQRGHDSHYTIPDTRADVLDLLTQLVDKSLVLVDKDAHEPRYRLLETIRQYGRERLVEAEEARAVHERHLIWCVELAERTEPELRGPRQVEWLNRLDAENDNLRAALQWGLVAEPEVGARLAGHLWLFWYFRSQISEGIRWMDATLAMAPRGTVLYAKLLAATGLLLRDQDHIERSRACTEEALVLGREINDDRTVGWALNNLGNIARSWAGDLIRARSLHEQSIERFRAAGDRAGVGMGLRDLGLTAMVEGEQTKAQALLDESLEILRQVDDSWNCAWTLAWLADIALQQGRRAQTRAMAGEAEGHFRHIGNAVGIIFTQWLRGELARLDGEYGLAGKILMDTLRFSRGREIGLRSQVDNCLNSLGKLAVQRGDLWQGGVLLGAVYDDVSLSAVAQIENEAIVTKVRLGLGEDRFGQAWAEGKAMTRAQAIAYALQGDEG